MKKILLLVFVIIFCVGFANGQDTYRQYKYMGSNYVRKQANNINPIDYYEFNDFSFYHSKNEKGKKINLINETNGDGVLVCINGDDDDVLRFLRKCEFGRREFQEYCKSEDREKIQIPNKSVFVKGMIFLTSNSDSDKNYVGYVVKIGKKNYFLDSDYLKTDGFLKQQIDAANLYCLSLNKYCELSCLLNNTSENNYENTNEYRKVLDECEEKIDSVKMSLFKAAVDSLNRVKESTIMVVGYGMYQDAVLNNKLDSLVKKYEPYYKNLSGVEFYMTESNSAGGHDFYFSAFNTSKKTIKYINFSLRFKNRVNDYVYCEIRGRNPIELQGTGPIYPGDSFSVNFDNVVYNSTASDVIISSCRITYMDLSFVDISHSTLIKNKNLYEEIEDVISEIDNNLENTRNAVQEGKILNEINEKIDSCVFNANSFFSISAENEMKRSKAYYNDYIALKYKYEREVKNVEDEYKAKGREVKYKYQKEVQNNIRNGSDILNATVPNMVSVHEYLEKTLLEEW